MRRKKLDSLHVFLQFLMLFLSLLAFVTFAFLVDETLWIESVQERILALSTVLSFAVVIASFKIYFEKRESKEFFFLSVGFLLYGILNTLFLFFNLQNRIPFFSYTLGGDYSILVLLSKVVLASTFFFTWILKEKSIEKKKEKRLEIAERILILAIFLMFLFFLAMLSLNRSYCILLLPAIVLMFLLLSFVGQIFVKEWIYKDFSFWLIFSTLFFLISEIFYLPFLNINSYSLANLSIIAIFFGHIAILFGLVNNIYQEKLNGKASKNKKVSKKI